MHSNSKAAAQYDTGRTQNYFGGCGGGGVCVGGGGVTVAVDGKTKATRAVQLDPPSGLCHSQWEPVCPAKTTIANC
jgi:hypothetical protein